MKEIRRRLTLVIPLYNEEECIDKVIPEILEFCQGVYDVIIVDDGSTDNSNNLLQEYFKESRDGVRVLSHEFNKGYGAAIKTGIKGACTDYVVTLDADGQHRLEDVDSMFEYMLKSKVDLLIGSRFNNKSKNLFRHFGKWVIRSFTKFMIKLDIKDLNSGLKMYRREKCVEILDYCPDGMSFSDSIVIVSLISEYKISEVDIVVNDRFSGNSKVNASTLFETIMSIVVIVVLNNPLRFFIPLSFGLLFLGVVWGGYFIVTNQGVSVATSLLLMLSAIIFTSGLISQQISQIWRQMIRQKKS